MFQYLIVVDQLYKNELVVHKHSYFAVVHMFQEIFLFEGENSIWNFKNILWTIMSNSILNWAHIRITHICI